MTKEHTFGVGVGVMLMNKDEQILLGRRHEDPDKADSELHGEGTWTMPGGKVDPGETLANTAVRELKEETDIDTAPENLSLISVTDDIIETDSVHFVTIGFLCHTFDGDARIMEPDEITEWEWFALNALPENVFPPSQKIIENHRVGAIYSLS